MANVVITSTTNSIKIVWNDAADLWKKEVWHKSSIHLFLAVDETFVQAREDNETDKALSWNGAGDTLQVDSIDGVAPTSNSDLYDKLAALIA